jgi:hypothetical protein
MHGTYLDRDLPSEGLQGGPQRLVPAAYDNDLPHPAPSPAVVELLAESPRGLLHRTHPLAASHQ